MKYHKLVREWKKNFLIVKRADIPELLLTGKIYSDDDKEDIPLLEYVQKPEEIPEQLTTPSMSPKKVNSTAKKSLRYKKCNDENVCNPKTDRCVKKSGKIGKKIFKIKPEPEEIPEQLTPKKSLRYKKCNDENVCNPKTDRCVKKSGKIGKKILGFN